LRTADLANGQYLIALRIGEHRSTTSLIVAH
jgi:hypothetical protein